jgi:hypothetical protein
MPMQIRRDELATHALTRLQHPSRDRRSGTRDAATVHLSARVRTADVPGLPSAAR